jgi:hypothetical protein
MTEHDRNSPSSFASTDARVTLTSMAKPDDTPAKPTCTGITKAGTPCKSTLLLADGACVIHSDLSTFDPVEAGRKGGRQSGATRRALAKSARERLRELAENDDAMWRKVKAAYEDGLEALGPDGMPDYRGRVQAADAFLSQAYGKPVQTVTGEGGIQIVIAGMLDPRPHAGVIDAGSRGQADAPALAVVRDRAALPPADGSGDVA